MVKPSGRSGLGFLVDQIPIGLEYIAAYIEDTVEEIHIVDMEMEWRSFRRIIEVYLPDLVGITMCATEHNEGLRLARIAKKYGVTTVVGGYHPTSAPDLMLSYPQLDMVIRGEGEITMRELIEKGSPEEVLGISYRENGRVIHNEDRPVVEDLDSLPFPARHLRQYSYKASDRKIDYDALLTSRGCYGRCVFCCEPSMNHGRLRCRSPENVVEEVLEIARYHEWRPVNVFITDPSFMANPARVGRLSELLLEHDLNMVFNSLVRTDDMARRPEIVKRMCEAGILFFEMGIESPNPKDLESTKKGITLRIHKEAVRNIREHGGGAGGTFVIGLPDQTEEEIRRFPTYAKEIGLTAAAFGVVTPFPGTEFYEELDGKGLIFETNWDNFDEMHSVYKTEHLSKEKIEELANYCMAKFWNIDTFIDRETVFQRRTKRKKALIDFTLERAIDARFLNNAGMSLKREEFGHHAKLFLEAYPDPRVEAYTREVGVHNVLEMSRFLRILGPQTIQCSLGFDETVTSFVVKTTKNRVEYIKVINGGHDGSTLSFDIDLRRIIEAGQESTWEKFKGITFRNWSIKKLWNAFRFVAAVGTELLMWKLSR